MKYETDKQNDQDQWYAASCSVKKHSGNAFFHCTADSSHSHGKQDPAVIDPGSPQIHDHGSPRNHHRKKVKKYIRITSLFSLMCFIKIKWNLPPSWRD